MFYPYYLIWVILKLTTTFSNSKPQKIIVYYDKHYKKEWFTNFSNYPIKYVSFKHSSNYATHIIRHNDAESSVYKIYLISKDLLYDIHGKKNYKIKGLSYISSNLSVVTIKNMTDKNVIKVVTHEFAHGRGLSHCKHRNCIMNDAKGKYSNLKNCSEFKENCLIFIKKESKLKI